MNVIARLFLLLCLSVVALGCVETETIIVREHTIFDPKDRADYEIGLSFYRAGELDKAEEKFRPIASRGEEVAQMWLGITLIAKGRTEEGIKWLEDASSNFSVPALYLADLYSSGEKVDKDPERAMHWLARAFDTGEIMSRDYRERLENIKKDSRLEK